MMQQEISLAQPRLWFPYSLGMDAVRQFILDESQKAGNSLAKWSKAIGRNAAYLHQFIHKNSPRKLPEEDRTKLSMVMGVDETLLGGTATARVTTQNARVAGPVQLAGTIPAYGHAVGGKDGQFILNGNKISDILAPPIVAGVTEAYAVYVVGESMEPRYMPGEAVFVNPKLPVRRGDFVIAQIVGADEDQPEAYIKRFAGRDAKHIRLEQFNPRKTLQFPLSKVISVHRIVMGGDG